MKIDIETSEAGNGRDRYVTVVIGDVAFIQQGETEAAAARNMRNKLQLFRSYCYGVMMLLGDYETAAEHDEK